MTEEKEVLLTENKQRFVLFPIKYPKIWEMVRLGFLYTFPVQEASSQFLGSRRDWSCPRPQGLAETKFKRAAFYQECFGLLCCLGWNCARESGKGSLHYRVSTRRNDSWKRSRSQKQDVFMGFKPPWRIFIPKRIRYWLIHTSRCLIAWLIV